MPRKSQVTDNPIRILRLSVHQTLETFAQRCGIHLQALYLNEMGMYPTVLPSVMRYLHHNYDVSETETEEDYQNYVRNVRYSFGDNHVPYDFPEPNSTVSSIRQLRSSLGISTAFGFAKAICLNPTIIRNVESGKIFEFPGHLNFALREIQVDPADIDELEYRHQEFFQHASRSKSQRRAS